MAAEREKGYWLGRIIGGIIVAGATMGTFWWWESELSLEVQTAIAVAAGLAFLLIGGDLWRWINRVDWLSWH